MPAKALTALALLSFPISLSTSATTLREREAPLPQEELERNVERRSLDPDNPVALEELAELMGSAGQVDDQVAYLLLAIDAYDREEFEDEGAKKDKLKALQKALKKVDSGLSSLPSARKSYLGNLSWALELYAQNQLKPRNALQVGERILSYRPDHPAGLRFVELTLEQLSAAERTRAERLLWQKELQRSRSFRTRWARDHRGWSSAGVFESDRYRVRTNAGYEIGQKACRSLEAMSNFFNAYYGVNRSLVQGKTEILICRTHDEFRDVANNPITESPGLLAFIQSQIRSVNGSATEIESKVYAFDPRDRGRSVASLWPTLWHEASHQYMLIRAKGKPTPLWFNEGMSTYFESATFSSSGEVNVGTPAMPRLRALVTMLSRDQRPLQDLIGATGSLTGEQYAAAWGLVYYLRHGRDEEGRLLRPNVLTRLLASVSRGVVSGEGLFHGEVLSPRQQSLEAFEDEWKAAMLALHAAEAEPEERARELVELGKLRLADDDVPGALDLWAAALLRDNACLEAIQCTTDVHVGEWKSSKRKDREAADRALVSARREHELAGALGESAHLERAESICLELDKAGFPRIQRAEAKYRKKIDKLLARLVERERPKTAVAVAKIYLDDVLGSDRSTELARELRVAGSLTLERPYLPFNGVDLEGLTASERSFRVEGGEIVGSATRPSHATLQINRELGPRFALEGALWIEDPNTVVGLLYSDPRDETSGGFALRPAKEKKWKDAPKRYEPFDLVNFGQTAALEEVYSLARGGVAFELGSKPIACPVKLEAGGWHRFRIACETEGECTLTIDGQPVAKRTIAADAPGAQLGLLVYGGTLRIKDLRAVEFDRL